MIEYPRKETVLEMSLITFVAGQNIIVGRTRSETFTSQYLGDKGERRGARAAQALIT